MKRTLLILPFIVAPAFAGTSAKEVVTPPAPTCLTTWFAGASVGYLTNFDAAMYNVHLGVTNSCWNVAGWNVSLYAEVGYTDKTETYDFYGGTVALFHFHDDFDVTIVPITANIKFEHQITGNLNAYIGGGIGAAWVNVDATLRGPNIQGSLDMSDSNWVFCAQIFAGLSYDVSPNCEIYGGGRWIYLADPNLFGGDVSIGDDWLVELGVRFKF